MKRARNQAKLLTAKNFSEAKNLDEFKDELRKIDNLNTSIEGKTVLHIVSAAGKIGFVKYLLDKGADISAIDNDEATALHIAAQGGHTEVVRYLLNNGADIDAINDSGETALHLAAWPGHTKVVGYLLNNGADIDPIEDIDGATALHMAAGGGHIEVVKCLLEKGAGINAKNYVEATALHDAAQGGHIEVVKYLLDKGADINSKSNSVATALHIAARFGHKEVVEYLLYKGVDINSKSNKGATALHYAAVYGHLNVFKFLLSHKARICAKSFNLIKGRFSDWRKKITNTLLIRVKDSIEDISNWDRVLEDWQGCAPVLRLDVLSQACLETGRSEKGIEFQKEIFYHKDSTEEEQSNAANLVAMSLIGSSPQAEDYIKALEYAVFEEKALGVVIEYFNEQIENKNYDAIDKISVYYNDNEVHDKSKLKVDDALLKLQLSKIAAQQEQDISSTSMLP